MSKINKTKYALLGILSVRPGSGYDIKKRCDYSISHFWNENYAHIYPVLKTMENEGLVVKETEQSPGRPPKNIYSITEKGREELNEWLLKPVEETPARSEFLLKLFFSSGIPLDKTIERLRDGMEKAKKEFEELVRTEENLTSDEQLKNNKSFPMWLATLRYGKYNAEAGIKWCEETISMLLDGKSRPQNEGDEK
ncbi:MAG TPA: PadR family transcriptional regulator [Clostridia bacterium]